MPRLAVAWAQWQMSNYPDKYKILFDEEWLKLWMYDLADISTSTSLRQTIEDVIKHWGGEPAQVCMVVVVVYCNSSACDATSLTSLHHRQQHGSRQAAVWQQPTAAWQQPAATWPSSSSNSSTSLQRQPAAGSSST